MRVRKAPSMSRPAMRQYSSVKEPVASYMAPIAELPTNAVIDPSIFMRENPADPWTV